jgi:hypothetical protein
MVVHFLGVVKKIVVVSTHERVVVFLLSVYINEFDWFVSLLVCLFLPSFHPSLVDCHGNHSCCSLCSMC